MSGGGTLGLPAGAWSDDTAMALCVAESFLEMGAFDARDQMNRYRRWQQEGHLSATGQAAGLRPAVRKAIALAGWRRAAVAGSHDPQQLDAEPLVRCIAPALYFHRDFGAAVAAGADTARVTHQAPVVLDACRLMTGMLHAALAGQEKAAVVGLAGRWPGPALKQPLQQLADSWGPPPRAATVGPGSILGALDAAVRAFLGSGDFGTGLLQLVNRGADSDITAAAYGQLAGAYYGVEGIPRLWRDALLNLPRLEDFADRLLQGRGL